MRKMNRVVNLVLLSGVMIAPVSFVATGCRTETVYDHEHKDAHKWDGREDAAYHQYLNEQHKDNRDYKNLNDQEQKDYWNWRHQHPDH